ncbi:hypothetical protein [Desulfovermiculus halophilus]|uniref:hypothetical protein n=1 Tax=Desulfovermiculus halophilus TaxID=339722 RepID=UPI00129481E7|nr:hypothetical protein [Desulfovermiculus halophilus]
MKRKTIFPICVLTLFSLILLSPLSSPAEANKVLFSCDFDTGSGDELDRWQSAAASYGLDYSTDPRSERDLAQEGVDGSYCARSDARDGHAYTPITIHFVDDYPEEVTINYWEKIHVTGGDGDLPVAGANIKSLRVYNNSDSSTYSIGSILSHHFDSYFYSRSGGVSTVEFGDIVYDRKDYSSYYAKSNGDGTYTAIGDGENDESHIAVKMSPWVENNKWYNLRVHIKYPSNDSTYDGEYTVWLNDNLVFRATDLKLVDGHDTSVKDIRFLPDQRGDEGFYQYLDEITVYEGYVPPNSEEETSSLPAPSDLQLSSR